jgi:hypothetical protein
MVGDNTIAIGHASEMQIFPTVSLLMFRLMSFKYVLGSLNNGL